MILVDSSVWIDYFRGTETASSSHLDAMLGSVPIAVGDLVVTEVLQGFREEKHFRIAKALLDDLTLVEMLGYERAVAAAQLFRRLRSRGVTIRKTNDVIIGSWCIAERVPLLYSDRDFDRMVEHGGLQPALPLAST